MKRLLHAAAIATAALLFVLTPVAIAFADTTPAAITIPTVAPQPAAQPAPVAVAPVVVTMPSAPSASTGLSDAAQWIIGMVAAALSACVGWLLTKAANMLHINANSAALVSLESLVDNGIDLARQWGESEAGKLLGGLSHDNMVLKTFDIVWPLASKLITSLGWSEAALKTYISTRLAPTTP